MRDVQKIDRFKELILNRAPGPQPYMLGQIASTIYGFFTSPTQEIRWYGVSVQPVRPYMRPQNSWYVYSIVVGSTVVL
ncbi:MAG: hypothetical protein ACK53Y_26585, partial [bacterium]